MRGASFLDLKFPRPVVPFEALMIQVTPSAVQQLQALLKDRPADSGKGLRVQIAKGGCSGLQYEMELAHKRANDAVIEQDGVQFLVDPESAVFLNGATLDYRDGLTGTGFH